MNLFGFNISRGNVPAVKKASSAMGSLDREFFYNSATGAISASVIQKQPYKYHPWTFAAAYTTMTNLSRMHFVLVKKDDEKNIINDHQVLDVLRKPNVFFTRSTMIQSMVANLLLSAGQRKGGQCFLICSDKAGEPVELARGDMPVTIMPVSDKYVKPDLVARTDGVSFPKGWKYDPTGHGTQSRTYTFDQMIRIYQYNPYTLLEGVANEQSAQTAIMQDIKADLFNTNLFDNMAIPAGVLESEEDLGVEKKREMLAHWYEVMGGTSNNNKTAILDGNLKYQKIGLTNADMQFKEARDFMKSEILASFHLNKIAVGDYENINRATLIEGRRMLWHDVYLPLGELICEAINSQWISNIDNGSLRLKFDTSKIQALKEDYVSQAAAAKTMVDAGLPPILAFQINGIPLPDDAEEKYPWLSENQRQSVGGALGISAAPATPAPKKEDGEEPDETNEPEKQLLHIKLAPTLKDRWTEYIKKTFDPGEQEIKKIMIAYFNGQRNRILDKVDEWSKSNKSISGVTKMTIAAADFLPELEGENVELKLKIRPALKDQMKRDADQLSKESIKWKVTDPYVDEYLEKRGEYLDGINKLSFEKVLDEVKDVLSQAEKDNLTVQEIAKKLKTEVNGFYEIRKGQAKTIARTETLSVSGNLRFDAMEDNGIEYIQWLNAGDEEVREEHQEEPHGDGGRIVKLGEPFPVTGLLFPGDFSTGDPSQTINCRCVHIGAEKPEGAE